MSAILDEEYVTVAEAAAFLKVSQSTIWRWVNRGMLSAYRIGQRRVVLRKAELVRLIAPARQGRQKGGRRQKALPVPGPLTSKEQEQMLAAIEGARRFQTELLKRRSGKPFPSSEDIINELREERTDNLQ